MEKRAQWALVGAAWFLAVSVAVIGFLAYERLAAPAAANAAAVGQHRDGTAICPVTGQVLQVLTSTPKVDYLGTVYYFSGDQDAQGLDARTRFLMDPDKYLKAPSAP